jgi:hypothetical protein
VPVKQLKSAAEAHCLAWRTVERAKVPEVLGTPVSSEPGEGALDHPAARHDHKSIPEGLVGRLRVGVVDDRDVYLLIGH